MKKTGVLLVNLGSPHSPFKKDVQRYLNEFLMDKRVLDVPYPIRRLIVSLFILPNRPKRSARAYRAIWWREGSPMIVITKRVQYLLQKKLPMPVAIGMRYGQPSIRSGLKELWEKKVNEIILVPLYPHYAMSTFETVVEKTRTELQKNAPSLSLKIIKPFYNHPAYITALTEQFQESLTSEFDHLLFSYHGIPERHLRKTDPTGSHCLQVENCCRVPSPAHLFCYRHQVLETTRLLVEKLGLSTSPYSVAFQSRLGRGSWLKPDTLREIERVKVTGVRRLAVICPSFVSDCLETLEEIQIRAKRYFLDLGGEQFIRIPCLNDHPAWISALESMISEVSSDVYGH